MLDLELASRITIITNRALCGGEAALLARIADFTAAGVGEIVVREKDLDEDAYAALFSKILLACENGFCANTARAVGMIVNEASAAKFSKTQAFAGELDASAAYTDKILLCERDEDEVSPKKLHSGGSKSELYADAVRKHAATDEVRCKNSARVLDEISSENFIGAANCANDSAPGEILLRGAVCKTKLATRSAQSTDNANGAENMQGAVNTGGSQSAQYTESSESIGGVENSQSVKEAENSQSAAGAQIAEGARRLPAIFVHNFADFALRARARNLWLPLGVLRSFSAAHGADFLRANFKKLVASCHSEAEAREALELGAGAICLSHIFTTDCKAGLAPKGINLIRAVREFFAGEIYALGGITPRNFASVLRAGADRIAVMSSAMAAQDASDFIRKFKK
ncbi:thiamine phosphate synthase [uncultured Campylobacter sp.]|uniref:thiamine phosphate synthase n=1 Tax=uncultured Campylobacter sp. TaxID=218934 RepID=UPI00260FA5D8|nr:thiamine phosphate synthase [uncultured Campylobacter sp.]